MIDAGNESLGIADHDMEPVKQAGVGIVDLVLVRKIFQGRDVAAITTTADHTVLRKSGLGKFSDGSLFDVGCDPHFEMTWIALAVQRQRNKSLRLFRTTTPLFALYRTAKVCIVEVYHAVKLMLPVPLAHSCADSLEHTPGSLIGRPQLAGELDCRNPAFILAHQIEGQKPLHQRHMGLM